MMSIVFIEGVSGVGKSTTVKLLSDSLAQKGFSVRHYLEGDFDSPLDLCWVAYLTTAEYNHLVVAYPFYTKIIADNIVYENSDYVLLRYRIDQEKLYSEELDQLLHKKEFCYNPLNSNVPITKFTEVFQNLWERFAFCNHDDTDYIIFDASLVSHMTSDLMRNYNANASDIIVHINTLLTAINQYSPKVFYLSSSNVKNRLLDARKSRNQTVPSEEKIKFWEKRKIFDMLVIPNLSVDVSIIDIDDGNWDNIITKIEAELTKA